MALLAFVPQLWSQPGVADSDNKSYLYLDAGRFLRQSASMWDPTVGLGTVTHEQIGYLFPLGPFFWAVQALGVPLWVGQRLWVGLVLFGAGSGVLYLCRTFRLEGPGPFVAAVAYMLSPYWLQDLGRSGVLILPWAGLGFMVGFVIRGVRQGGWRYPALFTLVWFTISGNNASGPIYAAVAPLLWLLYAVFVVREHTLRQAWSTLWRIVVLTAGVSLWWAYALAIEAGYGLNVLGTTEKVSAVARTALSSEVLRGLGYWFFYGSDIAGPWAATSAGFTQQLWLIGLSFAVPILALAAAVVVRWRHRAFFILLIVVGVILAVGSHPYAAPSSVGGLIKSFMTKTTEGLALRSTNRATPMVLLGLAVLLGAGITALARRRRVGGWVVAALALVLVGFANPPVWNGSTVLDRYTFPTPVPKDVRAAASALNAENPGTRVLAIPGQNDAAYTFGTTIDPIWPGLLTRPFVTRQQLALGSLPSYDMTYALDVPMQNRTADPASLAPMARLMSVGDVLVQNDLDYELYDRPPPKQFWQSLDLPQAGLQSPVGFGTPTASVSPIPMVDESTLAAPPDEPNPAPLEVLGVDDPRPIARAESTQGALVVAGDAVGLNDIAGLGVLDTTSPVLYAGTLDGDPRALSSAMQGGATLVLTDTNRKQSFLWNVVSDNAGVTLAASDPKPNVALDIFPGAPADAQSTAQYVGISSVSSVPDDPDHSAAMAIDGLPDTAWETHISVSPLHKSWQVTLDNQVTTGKITILQPAPGDYQVDQWITRARLTFDGGSPVSVKLGAASRVGPGPGGVVRASQFHDAQDHHRGHQPERDVEGDDDGRLAGGAGRGRGGRRPGPGGHQDAPRPPRRGGLRLAVAPSRRGHDAPARGPHRAGVGPRADPGPQLRAPHHPHVHPDGHGPHQLERLGPDHRRGGGTTQLRPGRGRGVLLEPVARRHRGHGVGGAGRQPGHGVVPGDGGEQPAGRLDPGQPAPELERRPPRPGRGGRRAPLGPDPAPHPGLRPPGGRLALPVGLPLGVGDRAGGDRRDAPGEHRQRPRAVPGGDGPGPDRDRHRGPVGVHPGLLLPRQARVHDLAPDRHRRAGHSRHPHRPSPGVDAGHVPLGPSHRGRPTRARQGHRPDAGGAGRWRAEREALWRRRVRHHARGRVARGPRARRARSPGSTSTRWRWTRPPVVGPPATTPGPAAPRRCRPRRRARPRRSRWCRRPRPSSTSASPARRGPTGSSSARASTRGGRRRSTGADRSSDTPPSSTVSATDGSCNPPGRAPSR